MRSGRLSLILVALLAGCSPASPDEAEVLVRVNGEAISLADLKLERAFHHGWPQGAEKAGGGSHEDDEALLQSLVDLELASQRAVQLEMTVSDREIEDVVRFHSLGASPAEFEKQLRSASLDPARWRQRLKLQALAEEVFRRENSEKVVITPAQVRDYYWEHVTRYRHKERVQLRQIVCATREQAQSALNELRLGDPFEAVARRYSQGPEAELGGLVGWVDRKMLPQGIEEVAFSLKKGKVSDLVKTVHGWHLLKLEARQRPRNLSVEEATPRIRESLKEIREKELYRDWLFGLRQEATVEWLLPEKLEQEEKK